MRPIANCLWFSTANLILCSLLTGQVQKESRRYSLESLLAPLPRTTFESDEYVQLLHLPAKLRLRSALINQESSSGLVFRTFPAVRIERERLQDLIQRCWEDSDDVQNSGHSIFQRRQLRLTATAEIHEQVRDLLVALEASRRRLELTLHALPKSASVEQSKAILDAPAVDRLLNRHPPENSERSVMIANVSHVTQTGAMQQLLLDFNVEVAQASAMADPKFHSVFEGRYLGAIATPLVDGRILVHAGLHDSQFAGPIAERVLLGKGLGRLQRPSLQSRIVVSSGVIEDAGGILIGGFSEAHPPFLLRVRKLPGATSRAGSEVELLSLGNLLHPTDHLQPDRGVQPVRVGPDFEDDEDPDEDDTYRMDSPLVKELLDQIAGGVLGQRRVRFEFVGNHLLVKGPKEERDRLRAALIALAGEIQPLSVQYRIGKIPAARAQNYLRGDLSPGEMAALLPTRGVLSTLPDHSFRIVEGVESTDVRDYEVEIAQESVVANPVVRSLFSGVSFDGVLTRGVSGQLRCTGRFTYMADPVASTFDTEIEEIRIVDATKNAFTYEEFSSDLDPEPTWKVLHLQPLEATKESVVLMIRVQ